MKVTSLIIPNIKFLTISARSASAHLKRRRYQPRATHFQPALLYTSSSIYNNPKMTKFEPVTHAIFDMDGVILDTEKIYFKVLSTIANRYGKEFVAEVRVAVLGVSETDCAKIMVDGLKLPITAKEFHQQQCELQAIELKDAEIMPGSERLIRHLYTHGVPLAVATSSGQDSVDTKTASHASLFSCFSHIVCGTTDPEVKRGKPNPDIFLVTSSRFRDNPDPAKCLVFEDAPAGMRAGRAAGMQVVMTPAPETPDEKCEGATLVLNSLIDFQPELFGLPPYN